MAAPKPIVLNAFDGLDTRNDIGKAAPGRLTEARNIRYLGESIVPRPGMSLALVVPLSDIQSDTNVSIACVSGTATLGTPYSSALVAIGGTAPYSWSIIAGSLPTGLSLNGATGIISGTPSATGTFNFTIHVQDALGNTWDQPCSIAASCPSITVGCPTSSAKVGVAYDDFITASGGTGPYTFAIITGALPDGLTLNTSTGEVTGTPTTANTYDYTARATDVYGCIGTHACEIVVAPSGSTAQVWSQAFLMDCETIANNKAFKYNAADWPMGTTFTFAGTSDFFGDINLTEVGTGTVATLHFTGVAEEYKTTGPLALVDGKFYTTGVDVTGYLFANIASPAIAPVILSWGDTEQLHSNTAFVKSLVALPIDVADYPGMTSARFRCAAKWGIEDLVHPTGTLQVVDEANTVYFTQAIANNTETFIDSAITLSGSHSYYVRFQSSANTHAHVDIFLPQIWIFGATAGKYQIPMGVQIGIGITNPWEGYSSVTSATYAEINGTVAPSVFRKTAGIFVTQSSWELHVAIGDDSDAGKIALFNKTTGMKVTGSEIVFPAGAGFYTVAFSPSAANFTDGDDFVFRGLTTGSFVDFVYEALFVKVT